MFIISNELTKQLEPCAKQPCAKQPCANIFKNIKIVNGPIQKELVKEIMKEDGFLFIK
jgi:hypothetical protein